ncbi:MAG: regulatory protein RecX [Flavobacteriales bacterium]
MKPKNDDEFYNYLVDWCNKAERCAFDITKKAARREIPKEKVIEWIERLKKSGLVNHERYAESFAHDHYLFKKWGVNKIKYALKSKHIEEEFIQRAMAILDPKIGLDHLQTIILRDANRLERIGVEKWKASIIRKCVAKGYALDRCLQAVNSYLKGRIE